MKNYTINDVEAVWSKKGRKYIADFFTSGHLLEQINPSDYWGLEFGTVREVKQFADNLSCGIL
ncbi:MAG: hypothetical protein AAF806_30945 [Bacteroidota bacterium]